MKQAILFILLTSSALCSATDLAKINEYEKRILAMEKGRLESSSTHISDLKRKITALESSLKLESPGAEIVYSKSGVESSDFTMSFVLQDGSENYYKCVGLLKNRTFTYAEWVKIYFYFYKNNSLIHDDFTYIDYETYGYSGVLPFHETYFMTFINKVDFDSLEAVVQYERENGDAPFLYDQLLQHTSNQLLLKSINYLWTGEVQNIGNYSVEFPTIHANVFRSDSLLEADFTYLDTECQGDTTIIIDFVITSSPDRNEIVLYNCSTVDVNLSGWYLGKNDSAFAYEIPAGSTIRSGGYLGYMMTDLTFTFDDSSILYVSDHNKKLIDQWTNDENENILYPFNPVCYETYLDLPEFYDKISYYLTYSLHSIEGSGNLPPNIPTFTDNSYIINRNSVCTFPIFLIDPNEDDIEVQVSWNDGATTDWLGPFQSRTVVDIPHIFNTAGKYYVTARARDSDGETSQWSDSIVVNVTSSVPVELATFSISIRDGKVTLRWRTESESANLGFAIERSQDLILWEQIGFVRGSGTTVEQNDYSFIDQNAEGNVYYRLRQIDQDGSSHYSNTLSLSIEQPNSFEVHSIYPNPFNTSAIIQYEIAGKSNVHIDLFDIRGRHLQTMLEQTKNSGIHTFQWNATHQTSGTYLVRVKVGEQSIVQKCLLLK